MKNNLIILNFFILFAISHETQGANTDHFEPLSPNCDKTKLSCTSYNKPPLTKLTQSEKDSVYYSIDRSGKLTTTNYQAQCDLVNARNGHQEPGESTVVDLERRANPNPEQPKKFTGKKLPISDKALKKAQKASAIFNKSGNRSLFSRAFSPKETPPRKRRRIL